MKGQLRIEQMYAFVVVDDDGTEGIPAKRWPNGTVLPLVGADLERVEGLRPIAQDVATMLDKPVTLCHFSQRTEVEVIYPVEGQPPPGEPLCAIEPECPTCGLLATTVLAIGRCGLKRDRLPDEACLFPWSKEQTNA